MLDALLNTFFPRVCAACGNRLQQREKVVCTVCMHKLPVIKEQRIAEETIKEHFYGRVEVHRAASLLFYRKKGLSQHLIHQLKYRGDERISAFLGDWLSAIIAKEEWKEDIDMVLPVPLHKNRKRRRGYNQVTGFGQALANHIGCEFKEDILIKTIDSKTQVFKNRWARTQLENAYFTVRNEHLLKGKHLLLVDDIITTGATLETCAENLLKGSPSKISIATMAVVV